MKLDTKAILTRGVEIVSFVLTSFGGFLLNVAPPSEADSRFAVGLASVLGLFILILCSEMTKVLVSPRRKMIWLIVCVAFFFGTGAFGFLYKMKYDALTYQYLLVHPPATYVRGTVLTPLAQGLRNKFPAKTDEELVEALGGPGKIDKVWTEDSIRAAKATLLVFYVIFFVCVSAMLFGLTERLSVSGGAAPRDKNGPGQSARKDRKAH